MKKKEAFTFQLEKCPHLLQIEKAHVQQWGPSTAKKEKKKSYAAANIYSGCIDSDSYLIGIAQIFKL